MSNLHVDYNTQGSFEFNGVSKKFSLYLIVKHIGEENV